MSVLNSGEQAGGSGEQAGTSRSFQRRPHGIFIEGARQHRRYRGLESEVQYGTIGPNYENGGDCFEKMEMNAQRRCVHMHEPLPSNLHFITTSVFITMVLFVLPG